MRRRTEATGFVEAQKRIRACAKKRSEDLDLGGLRLRSLPSEIAGLPWLKRLYLGVDVEVRSNPASIFIISGLDTTKCNRLPELPAWFFTAFPELEELDLAFNGMARLPEAIASLQCLTSLDLSWNGIGADGARALAALTGLTSLALGSNSIGADGARALATLTGLTSLDLGSNGIGADGARALAALTGLTSLNLAQQQHRGRRRPRPGGTDRPHLA